MQNSIGKTERDLTSGPLLWQVICFSVPLMLTSVLQLLFNTADNIVVGRWGGDTLDECETALAAVGSCGSLINLIVNLFIGLSVGAGVCVAQNMGARDYNRVSRVVHTAVPTAFIAGMIALAVGIAISKPMLTLMGTDEEVLMPATGYMVAYFCGAPANMVYNYCASMLRSTGDTVRPLIFLTSAGVVNVGLNLIMVLVFHLGAVGVGIATAVSQWISCLLILIYMTHMHGVCHFSFSRISIDKSMLGEMLRIGVPAGLQSALFSISNVLIQSSVNSFGKTVVAGNTAAGNIEGYVYTVQNAVSQSALTFVGQCIGAKKYKRLKQSAVCCLLTVVAVGLSSGLIVLLFSDSLLSVYVPGNDAAIEAGKIRLLIILTTYFLCGVQEVGAWTMRGMGHSVKPMVVTLIGTCVFRIAWLATAFWTWHDLYTIYLSYPISWLITGLVHYIMIISTYRKLVRSGDTEIQPISEE